MRSVWTVILQPPQRYGVCQKLSMRKLFRERVWIRFKAVHHRKAGINHTILKHPQNYAETNMPDCTTQPTPPNAPILGKPQLVQLASETPFHCSPDLLSPPPFASSPPCM